MMVATAGVLGACHSSPPRIEARVAPGSLTGSVQNASAAAEQLHQGRKALDERNYVAAVTAFRSVRSSPEHAAEASNGLGVAYAGIGRSDLAERYFRDAMMLAPHDRRFRQNLARVQAEIAEKGTRMARVDAAGASDRAALPLAQGAARLVRVSPLEVNVRAPNASADGQRRRAANPPVTLAVTSDGGRRRNPGYPGAVQIASPGAKPGSGYPVRIAFRSAD